MIPIFDFTEPDTMLRFLALMTLCLAVGATAEDPAASVTLPKGTAAPASAPENTAAPGSSPADGSPTDASLILGASDAYADNQGTKIHYVTLGQGPLVVFIHGFPDFWYSWRYQMKALSPEYRCVAMDQRGFNLSDKPTGVENYAIEKLVGDVEAVIKAAGAERATIVGHDWGGFVAWWFASFKPEMVERLVICNLPHPKCLSRELVNNPEQQKMSAYAQAFRQPDAAKSLDKDLFSTMAVGEDRAAFPAYRAAMAKSDMEAMLNYYKANYPAEPYTEDSRAVPHVQAPTLVFHGLKDPALHHHGLNQTWEWVDNVLTIVTVPTAAHWVQSDASELVSNTILDWMKRN